MAPIVGSTTTNVTLAVLIAALPVVGGLLGASLGRWADARNRRRDQYADAVRVLVRWAEYPYRIRRRTSDNPEELRRLTDLGHELQEQLQCHRTWIGAESRWVGTLYADAVTTVKQRNGDTISEAWQARPIASGAEAVLNGWGPDPIDDVLQELNSAITCRFGVRRALAWMPSARWTASLELDFDSNVAVGAVCEFSGGFLESLTRVPLLGVVLLRSPERVDCVGDVVSMSVVLDGLRGVVPCPPLAGVGRIRAEGDEIAGRIVVVGGDELLDASVDGVADRHQCGEVVAVLGGELFVDVLLGAGDVEGFVGACELALQVLDLVGDIRVARRCVRGGGGWGAGR